MALRYVLLVTLSIAILAAAPVRFVAAQPGLPVFIPLEGTADPLGTLAVPNVGFAAFADLVGDEAAEFVFSPVSLTPIPPPGFGLPVATTVVQPVALRGGEGNVSALLFTRANGGFVPSETNPFAGLSTGDVDETAGAPVFGDLDGDGDADLVVSANTESTARFVYFENTGSAEAAAFTRRDGAANPFASLPSGALSLADLDGDGDLDAVSTVASFEGGADVRYFENVGTTEAATFAEAASPFADLAFAAIVFPLAFGDVDGDGDLDAASGELDLSAEEGQILSLRLLENVGTATAPSFQVDAGAFADVVIDSFANELVAPTTTDLDGDGDLDVVLSAGGNIFPETTFLANDGSGSFTARTPFENPVRLSTGIGDVFIPSAAADLDGDGDADLVLGNSESEPPTYYENVGSAEHAEFRRIDGANPFAVFELTTSTLVAPALGDLDGDGDLDAAVLTTSFDTGTGRVFYLENTGSASAPAFTVRTGGANPFGVLGTIRPTSGALADLDGDGDLDFAIAETDDSFTSELRYFENTGTAAAAAFTERTGAASPLPGVAAASFVNLAIGDLDADADADLLLTFTDVTSPTLEGVVRAFENVGTPSTPDFVERTGGDNPFSGAFVFPSQPAIVDLDGDGAADVVLGVGRTEEFEGSVELIGGRFVTYRNTGTTPPVPADPAAPSASSFAFQSVYPNPFSGELHLALTLGRAQPVTIAVYDALGRHVAVLHDGDLATGVEHVFRVDGSALAPGLYVVHARSASGTASQKVTKLR